ncbi:hypothetical protein ACA910_014665 [Epithemia clementina (nom. ined.)]
MQLLRIPVPPSGHPFLLLSLWTVFFLSCLDRSSAFVVVAEVSGRLTQQPPQQQQQQQSYCTLKNAATTSLFSSSPDKNGHDDYCWWDQVGFVVLAGGKGSRMKASVPKQFLELCGALILHYSLDLFLNQLPQQHQQQHQSSTADSSSSSPPPPFVVLVVDPMYQPDYQSLVDRYAGRLALASPGVERQGSVENGLAKLVEVSKGACTYAAIHDSARPLVTLDEIRDVIQDAKAYGAAVLAVPCKATIKESDDGGVTVLRTVPRARLFEVHTPQVIRIETLQRGFVKVQTEQLQVTDDVSIVEALGEPVKLTMGQYTNLKITTPEDLNVATAILQERQQPKPDI